MPSGTIGEVLQGVTVVDCGVGMPAALASKLLRETGARVIRVEPRGGDPGATAYPAYAAWRTGQEPSPEPLAGLVGATDICIVGGEDWPGVDPPVDAAALSEQHPSLIVLEIGGYPPTSAHRGRPAVEILVQARAGLTYEHFRDRPIRFGFEACTYGAVLYGLMGVFAALVERERSGLGQVVSTSLYEGGLHYALSFWSEVEHPTPVTDFVMPKDPHPLAFECADGEYLHIAMGSAGSKYRLYKTLGIDDPTVAETDSGVPGPTKDARNFFGDIDLLARQVRSWTRDDLQAALDAANVAAEKVLAPGEPWDDPQVAASGIVVEREDGTRHLGAPIAFASSPGRKVARRPAGEMPLDGVRVVDFGAFVAGPLASSLLADLGADVIKVEALGRDPSRGMFAAYVASNRGKRCLAFDIKSDGGRVLLDALVAGADVVTNNFRTGVSARLGLDATTLRAKKPELIVMECPAFGVEGPKATRAGFDPTIQAITGHEHRAGGAGNPPLWNRGFMADFTAGLIGAVALTVALYHQEHTGDGSAVSVPLLNGGLYALSELVQHPDGSFVGAPPLNAEQTGFHPAEALYELSDGWIALAVRDRRSARELGSLLGLGDALAAPPGQWAAAEAAAIAQALRARTTSDTLARLDTAGVWAEECRRDGSALALGDPELRALGSVATTSDPALGRVVTVGPLVRFSRSRRAVRSGAAACGAHTREILAELGLPAATVDELIATRVVAQADPG